MTLGLIKDIVARMVAVFIIASGTFISGGAVIGAVSNIQISPVFSAAMAGFAAILDVSVELARLYVGDGKITREEVNQAFRKASTSDKKETQE